MAADPSKCSSWEDAADDFGQKLDLSVRIREILRNYPEGLSIIKELIQNADDAGARTVKFCVSETRVSESSSSHIITPLDTLMTCSSLLVYNSAMFTETDFQSIQRIGDSLKKVSGTKTGRFGVGVNSMYHLTDVPVFVSGSKVVVFDPQAKYIPGINLANPGKLIDFSTERGLQLVKSLPSLFGPLKVFGCDFTSSFQGTMFRFALRSSTMAETSSLSHQAHSYTSILQLLQQLAQVAPSMLLFLKNVESIEIYQWASSSKQPTLVHETSIKTPVSDVLRKRRSYMLHASPNPAKPIAVDYIMEIESKGSGVAGSVCSPLERWIVCNQLGGGKATELAKDPRLAHLNLVPWAGIAAKVYPTPSKVDEEQHLKGAAYCFLPLPVITRLPVHVNGFFELSSNRRDIWWGEDMAGDGKYRAEWNKFLVSDIAAVCYCRLITACIKSKILTPETYQYHLPCLQLVGPWEVLGNAFYSAIHNTPVLFSQKCGWVSPSECVLLEDESDSTLTEILLQEDIPLVLLHPKLRAALVEKKVCSQKTTPAFIRAHFSKRLPASKENEFAGSLENEGMRIDYAKHLLLYCLSDLEVARHKELSGCQLIPLKNGHLGTLCQLPEVDMDTVNRMQKMGFTKLTCMHALRISKGDSDAAINWLFDHRHDLNKPFDYRVDPYFVCSGEIALLLKDFASNTYVDLYTLGDARLKSFFSLNGTSTLNFVEIVPEMIADVVIRVIPGSWIGVDSVRWSCEKMPNVPDEKWFSSLWMFICQYCSDFLHTLAEQYCIVPTNEGLVCTLSPGSAVIDASNLPKDVIDSLSSLGARTLLSNLLPRNQQSPKSLWDYIHCSSREGVIRTLETTLRRSADIFHDASDELKMNLFKYLSNARNGSMSKASCEAIRKFPIFRSYSNGGTIQFNALNSSIWYVIDFIFDQTLMDSKFLVVDNLSDLIFFKEIGVKYVKRKEFYRQFLIPSLPKLNQDDLPKAVEHLLVDLPILCADDDDFRLFLIDSKIIPSANSHCLRRASDLFDPEVLQLSLLLDDDWFPLESLQKSDLLLSMRSLGLQISLNWDVLITCAQSIDEKGRSASESVRERAKECGRELLIFLDQNFSKYFPEVAKNESKKSSMLKRMNAILFEDPEKKRKQAEEQAAKKALLLSLEWVPVLTSPPHPLLPWLEVFKLSPVASPISTIDRDNMWLLSSSHRIIDGRIQNEDLRVMFGWCDKFCMKNIATQLCNLSDTFERLLKASQSKETESPSALDRRSLCRVVTSHISSLYNELDKACTSDEKDLIQTILFGCKWLWIGDRFIHPEQAAFFSPINAAPYLYTVPQDLLVFDNLLKIFGVRSSFGTSDFISVLQQMNADCAESCQMSPSHVELAVNIVQIISDDVMKLNDVEIYAPSLNGKIFIATKMTFDDAPWLSKNLPSDDTIIFTHPKISSTVAEKIGCKSFRSTLLDKNKDVDFGANVLHESFSQSESITRRLKNILELYPEGISQFFELIQNADDANASIVRFLISKKHFGTNSLFGKDMSHWQGPSLIVYNDAIFEQRDFDNISRIGNASKLEKLASTGRFGLGFNSVYHWTDLPSFISGSKLVIFDPHKRYLPSGSDGSRGIKIHFSGSNLAKTFSDQIKPFCYFGCNGSDFFPGTLFRFPFRNDVTSSQSEISKVQVAQDDGVDLLIEGLRTNLSKVLLFLRNVKKIEMHYEGEGEFDVPELLYSAEVCSRVKVTSEGYTNDGVQQLKKKLYPYVGGGIPSNNEWNSISNFISVSTAGKDSFYSKLLSTPESKLPKTQHLVCIAFHEKKRTNYCIQERLSVTTTLNERIPGINDGNSVKIAPAGVTCQAPILSRETEYQSTTDEFLVVTSLGGGRPQIMACNPKFRHMKLLPWGGVAAHLSRNGSVAPKCKGAAFCFLPLPSETGLPVHINGYFELSSNRRDIWIGEHLTGEGKIRCEWNNLLLSDVIAPLYVNLLLLARRLVGPGDEFHALFPIDSSNDVWRLVVKEFYRVAERTPLFYSKLDSGQWVILNGAVGYRAVIVEEGALESTKITKHRLCDALIREGIATVMLPRSIIDHLKREGCNAIEATPSWIRSWFKHPCPHPSLSVKADALFLLKLCTNDLYEEKNYSELVGLPFLPLCDGNLGVINPVTFDGDVQSLSMFFVCSNMERELLCGASRFLVNVWTDDDDINNLLMSKEFHLGTNVSNLDRASFVLLLGTLFPEEWADLPEVRWDNYKNLEILPHSRKWISKLWHYIVSTSEHDQNFIAPFLNSWHILPAFVGDNEERTLLKISYDMAVVSPRKPFSIDAISGNIIRILNLIGVRVLDVDSFPVECREQILKILLHNKYVQQPTGKGIVCALLNTFPPDIETGDLIRRISIRFRNVVDGKDNLRLFLASSTNGAYADLEPTVVCTMRALPIFKVYSGNSGADEYSDIAGEVFLPPQDSDVYFLSNKFVKAFSREDEIFFKDVLKIKQMEKYEYFEKHVFSTFSRTELNANQEAALLAFLENFAQLSKSAGKEWTNRVAEKVLVPNMNGQNTKVNQLFDPTSPSVSPFLGETMLFPHKLFCQEDTLASLRVLGLQTKPTPSGVLLTAMRVQSLAMSENKTKAHELEAQKLGESLLRYLDDERNLQELVGWRTNQTIDLGTENRISTQGADCSSSSGLLLSLDSGAKDFFEGLKLIRWVPVETFHHKADKLQPPIDPRREIFCVSPPNAMRLKEDAWLCSYTTDIVSLHVRSDLLKTLFGWDSVVSPLSIASQLLALAESFDEKKNVKGFRQHLGATVLRCYEILDTELLENSRQDEHERVASLLKNKAWIWYGDGFARADQMAFEAPDNARPYLFSISSDLLCFSTLLKALGVKERFLASDYINLSGLLSRELAGKSGTPAQVKLAVVLAQLLDRLPLGERTTDLENLYLPAKDGSMHRATNMIFDDAPWLSSIVSSRSASRLTFVHPDIEHGVALSCGAKSFREVITAFQNGMTSLPCPKAIALSELFADRTGYAKGSREASVEDCRAILDLLEVAELKETKRITVIFDHRSYRCESLIHPMLAKAQGPSVSVCFHDTIINEDSLVKLSSPSRYLTSSISGEGGCVLGGQGPRTGLGICGIFRLTDYPQILVGNSLIFLDPTGECFFDGVRSVTTPTEEHGRNDGQNNSSENQANQEKPTAKKYQITNQFPENFPDQLTPFLALPVGVTESFALNSGLIQLPTFSGTIFRLPLRQETKSKICPRTFEDSAFIERMMQEFVNVAPSCFLFTCNLLSINILKWSPSVENYEEVLSTSLSSSSAARRNHIKDLTSNNDWKRRKSKSKLVKLLQSKWVPLFSSLQIQVRSRYGGQLGKESEEVDYFMVVSVLAPPKLQIMAGTDAMKQLKLLPALSIAAHIGREKNNSFVRFPSSKKTLCVGIPLPNEKTGLPFFVNAPLFQHELQGSILWNEDDDSDFRSKYAVRNVKIGNGEETRVLALHVWNKECLSSALCCLIPFLLTEVRNILLDEFKKMDKRVLYRVWPRRNKLELRYKDILSADLYEGLGKMEIYLTDKSSFQTAENGVFRSPAHQISSGALNFFRDRITLFSVPSFVSQDLEFGRPINRFDPSMARQLLREKSSITTRLECKSALILDILEYCLSDLLAADGIEYSSVTSIVKELSGLYIIPTEADTLCSFGQKLIVASPQQQLLLPSLKDKFVSHRVLARLERYFLNSSFLAMVGLEKFGPRVLANNLNSVLPPKWKGQDFVRWDSSVESPSKLWLYQFWKEVRIYDSDSLQLFRQWPLIPTTSGELASCSNAKFILAICPSGGDVMLASFLEKEFRTMNASLSKESKRLVLSETAIARAESSRSVVSDDVSYSTSDDSYESEEDVHKDSVKESATFSNIASQNTAEHADAATEENQTESEEESWFCSTDLKHLHDILSKLRCPLIELSYFSSESIARYLPRDPLTLSRHILITLNHCLDYWTTLKTGEQRLRWLELSGDDMDDLIRLLTTHRGTRLSLMPSDFSLLRNIPLFSSLSGERVSLNREEHFTLDENVNSGSLALYLPSRIQRIILTEIPEVKDLLQDLGIKQLTEGLVLQKYVLPNFSILPSAQRDQVCDVILQHWSTLNCTEFVDALKKCSFVKKRLCDEKIELVKPNELLDPRNDLFLAIFNKSLHVFPYEEFYQTQWLEILSVLGMKNAMDKDIFLKCAHQVEEENDVSKGIYLMEYFAENFGEFTCTPDFCSQLSEIKCVPALLWNEPLALYCTKDVSIPLHRHLVFRVIPVIPDNIAIPQIIFSSLKIVSPPSISVVLKQLRVLTDEKEGSLDQWGYKFGSIEDVFRSIFSFLEHNYEALSPRIQRGLKDRAIIPVGTTLVKSSRLFFRLSKDLSPFFYEVPRDFGAYDKLFCSLGVRQIPQSNDYAILLTDLKREIGNSRLNANELKSVIEVISLIAEVDKTTAQTSIFGPDEFSTLLPIEKLMQNDAPHILQKKGLNRNALHIVHPKVSEDLCNKLKIQKVSRCVKEHLVNGFEPRVIPRQTAGLGHLECRLNSTVLRKALQKMLSGSNQDKLNELTQLSVISVEDLQTCFMLTTARGDRENITLDPAGSVCFIEPPRILIAVDRLPDGVKLELAVASSLCDFLGISRQNVPGMASLLSSFSENVDGITQILGLLSCDEGELKRGDPGAPLTAYDASAIELRPLKTFSKGEIVAVKDRNQLVYALVLEGGGCPSLSHLLVQTGDGRRTILTSEAFSFRSAAASARQEAPSPSNQMIPGVTGKDLFVESSDTQGEIVTPMAPVNRHEFLRAVQDLLRSVNLGLSIDGRELLERNLKLQDELSGKKAENENLLDNCRDVATKLSTCVDALVCPITREVMKDPVMCADGHTYERAAIEQWLQSNSRSPKTNQHLPSRVLIPNHAVRQAIESMTESLICVKKFTEAHE